MTEIGSAFVRIRPDFRTFRAETQAGVKNAFRGIDKVAAGAFAGIALGAKAGAVGVGILGAAVGVAGFKFDNMRAQAQIAFTTMLGDGKKAKAFLDDLQAFAAKTPFEFPDLVRGSQRLLAMGFTADKIIPTMTAVGDAVAGLGGSPEVLNQVITALGQIQAKGKASAEEMLQLTEAGIPAWQMLADAIGKTVPEAMKLVSKGAIDSQTTVNAVTKGMEDRFGGMMDKQSHTFAGLWSTVKDTFSIISGTVMKPFFDLATAGLQKIVDISSGPAFTAGIQRFGEIMEKTVAPAITHVVGLIVGAVQQAMPAITRALNSVQAALPGILATGQSIVDFFRRVGPVVLSALEPVGRVAFAIYRDLSTIARQTLAALGRMFEAHRAELERIFQRISVVMKAAWLVVEPIVRFLFVQVLPRYIGIGITVIDKLTGAIAAIPRFFQRAWTTARDATLAFFGWIERMALQTALKVVEPFSHLPGRFGNWARAAKDELHAQLTAMQGDAGSIAASTGQAMGQNLYNGFLPWVGQITNAVLTTVQQAVAIIQNQMARVNAATIGGVAGTTVAGINQLLSLGSSSSTASISPSTFGGTGSTGGGASGRTSAAAMGSAGLRLSTATLTAEQRENAALIYQDVIQAGGTPQQALEMIAAAYMESGLRTGARNKKSGAFGLFQLLSRGYVDRYNQNIAKGMSPAQANIMSILPNYMSYFRAHPNFQRGEAGRDVEISGEGSSWYAMGYGHGVSLGPGGTGAGRKPAAAATMQLIPQDYLNKISRFGSKASALGNTGELAKSYLETEYGALWQAAQLIKGQLPSLTGKARDAATKALTGIQNKMDKVLVQIRDAVVIIGDALLPDSLRTRLSGLQAKYKAMSSLATVLVGDAAEKLQSTLTENIQAQAQTLRDELAALKQRLVGSTGKQRTAILAEFDKVRGALQTVNDQMVSALQSMVQSAQSRVQTILATVRAKMTAQFDAATQKLLDAAGRQFFQGALTPEEAKLQAYQTARAQQSLLDAYNTAASELGMALSQKILDPADIAAKRAALQAAQDALDLDRMQNDAARSRVAADKAYADAVAKIQADRQAKEQAMNDELDKLTDGFLNGTASIADLTALAEKYGIVIDAAAIPEMTKLASATMALMLAFNDLAELISRLTGKSPYTGEPGSSSITQAQAFGEVLADAFKQAIAGVVHIGGLAAGGWVKARPGGTVLRIAEGGEDELVLPGSRVGLLAGRNVGAIVAALSPLSALDALQRTNAAMLVELRKHTDLLMAPAPAFAGIDPNASAARAMR